MTEGVRRVFEELTKDYNQEEKEQILQIVEPGEDGRQKERRIDIEPEKVLAILEGIRAEIDKELEELTLILNLNNGEDLRRPQPISKE